MAGKQQRNLATFCKHFWAFTIDFAKTTGIRKIHRGGEYAVAIKNLLVSHFSKNDDFRILSVLSMINSKGRVIDLYIALFKFAM